jgi:cytochrome c
MASLDDQGVLFTWRPGEAQFSAVARIPGASTVAAALDGRLAVVSVDAEVLVVIDGALAGALEGASSRVLDLAISPDLRWVAAAEMNGEVAVWSLADHRLRMRTRGHSLRAAAVAFSVDAASLFSVSWDATARWWDLRALWADPEEEEAAARRAWGDDVADAVIGADAAPAP